MTARGRFITLEGIEGVGKSTQLAVVQECLVQQGLAVTTTREPGGTPLAEQIRALVLAERTESVPPIAELLLMFAARAAHLNALIQPALSEGRWIVCDRFTDASYAYQGGGRGIPGRDIASLERMTQGDLRPDLTLLFDAPPEVALARAKSRRGAGDRFEAETLSFFERARAEYLSIARREPGRVRIIDATQPLAAVSQAVRDVLVEFVARGRVP
jgi:dTMP kinase